MDRQTNKQTLTNMSSKNGPTILARRCICLLPKPFHTSCSLRLTSTLMSPNLNYYGCTRQTMNESTHPSNTDHLPLLNHFLFGFWEIFQSQRRCFHKRDAQHKELTVQVHKLLATRAPASGEFFEERTGGCDHLSDGRVLKHAQDKPIFRESSSRQ